MTLEQKFTISGLLIILVIVLAYSFSSCAPPPGSTDYSSISTEQDITYTGNRINRYIDTEHNVICYVYNSNGISCLQSNYKR